VDRRIGYAPQPQKKRKSGGGVAFEGGYAKEMRIDHAVDAERRGAARVDIALFQTIRRWSFLLFMVDLKEHLTLPQSAGSLSDSERAGQEKTKDLTQRTQSERAHFFRESQRKKGFNSSGKEKTETTSRERGGMTAQKKKSENRVARRITREFLYLDRVYFVIILISRGCVARSGEKK